MSPDELIAAAAAARARAYAPYSGYSVGAAILGAGGGVFAGCNVENAAYPQGQCAEANAIGTMIAGGEQMIVAVAVVGGGEDLCTPCGGCRQRLAEFGRPATPVYLAGAEGLREATTLGALLPMAFGPINLGAAPPMAGDAAAVIRRVAGGPPLVALVLGSGLGGIAERIADPVVVDYRDLPGFPRPSVQGHAGRLLLGTLGGMPVACLQGRAHLYEGVGAAPLNTLVRTLKAVGCRALILTNASGGLRSDLVAGSIALVEDHINLQGTNPLLGANDDAIGPRFVDLTEVYSGRLRTAFTAAAGARGIALARGVYLAVLGPAFETPAEIRAYRTLGADMVGMSTVPEAISARHAGLEVAALSVVTNLAAGLTARPLTHAETLSQSAAAVGRVGDLIEAALPEIARGLADLRSLIESARSAPLSADVPARVMPLIDLTSLKGGESPAEIEALCARAVAHDTAAVCIYAEAVPIARPLLAGSSVRVATVANFPHGGDDVAGTADETSAAVAAGADEVDIVAPISALLDGDVGLIGELVEACRGAAGPGITLKLILETGRLQEPDLITAAARAAVMAGIDFLKTSTGKVEIGATLEAAAALLTVCREAGGRVGFKAAGGIRTARDAAGYLFLADAIMGPDWVSPRTLRFGASSLLDDLLGQGVASAGY